jgi:predicted O-methyltransferase YrrM
MLELIGTTGYLTISNGNPYAEEVLHRIRSLGIDSPVVAEIGVGIGATTIKIARELDNKGTIHLFDFTEKLEELASDLRRLGYSNIHCYANTSKYWDSYDWTLAKFLLEGKRGIYDYIYVDGAHTFTVDGLAFFLCDRLLKPGGFLEFDDYNWKFSISPGECMRHTRQEFMTDEQLDTAQIAMVVDLFLKSNPLYEAVVENRIYRKCFEDGVTVQRDAALASRDAAYAARDSALAARDAAYTERDALLRSRSWRITAPLRAVNSAIRRR